MTDRPSSLPEAFGAALRRMDSSDPGDAEKAFLEVRDMIRVHNRGNAQAPVTFRGLLQSFRAGTADPKDMAALENDIVEKDAALKIQIARIGRLASRRDRLVK